MLIGASNIWLHYMMLRLKSFASELLENHEEMFPQYYVNSDVINRVKYSITNGCATRRERVKPLTMSSWHRRVPRVVVRQNPLKTSICITDESFLIKLLEVLKRMLEEMYPVHGHCVRAIIHFKRVKTCSIALHTEWRMVGEFSR